VVHIQRREVFCAAHRLYNDALSAQENEELFGKCSWEFGHGHNFEVWVTVKGEVNPKTGFVMNLSDLKTLMLRFVIDPLDHKHLAIEIWNQLCGPVAEFGSLLHCVRVVETENNAVEYFGA
jgi:6-pyruvoyltetrahydropterin/6-carboxytetrahydropterin synthase